MRKIICPTDFSETAFQAIAYAAKLAKKMNSELTLFNVQSLMELTPEAALMGKNYNVEMAEAMLEEQCEEVSKVFKISCYGNVATRFGSFHKAISEKAIGYDLVIMGTNGPDDFFQFFTGSNTYQVIKKSSVPVLLLPEGYGYTDISRIAYAFNYLHNHHPPVTQLARLVKQLECDLSIVQVIEKCSREAEEELLDSQEKILDLYGSEISILFDTRHASDVSEVLNNFVIQEKIDMLALCSVHHNFTDKLFHRSVIKTLSGIASYPVFVFHA